MLWEVSSKRFDRADTFLWTDFWHSLMKVAGGPGSGITGIIVTARQLFLSYKGRVPQVSLLLRDLGTGQSVSQNSYQGVAQPCHGPRCK